LDGAEICQSLLSRCEATPTLLVCAPLGEANQSGNLVVQKPLHQSSLRNLLHKLEGGSVEIQTQNLPQTPHQSLRILLAEDHPVNRKLAIRILESAGHQVRWAGDGAQALKMYQQEPFDLVILDMQMPVMDGVEAAERMRAFDKNKNRHTPILAMTANAFAEDRERCIKAGMDDYLAKPVRPQELLARIAAISAVLGSTARAG
jgi:CheY-like chemotaxis protein